MASLLETTLGPPKRGVLGKLWGSAGFFLGTVSVAIDVNRRPHASQKSQGMLGRKGTTMMHREQLAGETATVVPASRDVQSPRVASTE
jgi:hypothetical protein